MSRWDSAFMSVCNDENRSFQTNTEQRENGLFCTFCSVILSVGLIGFKLFNGRQQNTEKYSSAPKPL